MRRRMHLPRRGFIILAALAAVVVSILGATSSISQPSPPHNAIIFVADGLRHGSVNETDAPTLLHVRKQGVHFVNSHSLFPTFTTLNAAAIATGHYPGDTGDLATRSM